MRTAVLWLGFIIGLGVFAAWLSYMLRQEHALRVAGGQQSRDRVASHRHAARTARPVSVPVTTTHVVRAGSFCRVVGSSGQTKRGVALVCRPTANGRPRWARAEPMRLAS
jgi:hypothetical protein